MRKQVHLQEGVAEALAMILVHKLIPAHHLEVLLQEAAPQRAAHQRAAVVLLHVNIPMNGLKPKKPLVKSQVLNKRFAQSVARSKKIAQGQKML